MSHGLVMMACSGSKLSREAPAIDLYQGVMFQTLRTHRCPEDDLDVVIVSAEHGLLADNDVVEPYDRQMDDARAAELIAAGFPEDFYFEGEPYDAVMLAGGEAYRKVMRSYVEAMKEFGAIAPDAIIEETTGGIGDQRAQLGSFLAARAHLKDAA